MAKALPPGWAAQDPSAQDPGTLDTSEAAQSPSPTMDVFDTSEAAMSGLGLFAGKRVETQFEVRRCWLNL